MFTQSGVVVQELAPVETGISSCDDRPRAHVSGGFACDIAGFELGDSRVEVFEVEQDDRRDPLVAVDLDDAVGSV